jgi:hypothetical protein
MIGSGAGAAIAGALYWSTQERHRGTTSATEFKPIRQAPPSEPTTSFPIKPAREIGDALNPHELVLGIVLNDQARAYPVSMLNARPERKVLNDTLAGQAIAAVW